jgi:HlyD family secretion protein
MEVREGIKKVLAWYRRQTRRRRILIPAVPAAVILLLLIFGFNRQDSVQYFTAKVARGDILSAVDATGTINAVTTVQVGSQISGTISRLYADFNSKVKKGQVIAQIDPATFRARVEQAKADLENAQANVKSNEAAIETSAADLATAKANVDKARAQLTQAKVDLQRTLDLFQQEIVAAASRDSAQSNYDSMAASLAATEAQLEQAQARLKSARAQLDQGKAQVSQRRAALLAAQIDLSRTTIYAPIDGTVIGRNVDVGQTVAASLAAPTLFTIAQDLTKMQVYAKTDEADVGKIKVEAIATFKVDSFPRETFHGRVSQVRMNAYTVQNVVTYDTIIDFDNPDQKLFPGMTAYVTIPVASAQDVIEVPNGALRYKPEMSEEKRKELLAKYGIEERGREGGRPSASSGSALRSDRAGGPGAAGSPSAGQAEGSGGRRLLEQRAEAAGPAPAGGQTRGEDWQIVWRLNRGKNLEPVRIRTGITDYTFTELLKGNLKPGDELVIGQAAQRAQGMTQPPGGGFRGPGRR